VAGPPVRIEFAASLKPGVHAATFIRQRRIVLDAALRSQSRELERILIHELFHFTWLRIGNAPRWSYEQLLAEEADRRARGELGWSAEWRKRELSREDRVRRTRRWREYVCESFCDTAAWLHGRCKRHEEFTLAGTHRARRRKWFRRNGLVALISV
jgi:hypothetical protein